MNKTTNDELLEDIKHSTEELKRIYLDSTGPDAQGAMMDAHMARSLYQAASAIRDSANGNEDALGVIAWALKLACRGVLGSVMNETA